MKFKLGRIRQALSVMVAIATITACSGSVEEAEAPQTTSEPEQELADASVEFSELQQQVIADVAAARQNASGVWAGFELTDIPIVVFPSQAPTVEWAVVAGHPDATSIGDAALIDDYEDMSLVTNAGASIPLPPNGIFDFGVPIGGEASFVLVADHGFELALPGTEGFVSLIEHEAFHMFQDEWDQSGYADQSIEYDTSPENLQLALLEDAVLVAAVEAADDDARRTALEHFLAVRSVRLERFASTELDEGQEWVEGTAHWFEYLSGPALAPPYADALIDISAADPSSFDSEFMDPRQYFTWQRFYFSGAALLESMTQLGTGQIHERLAQGERPADIARAEFTIEGADVDALVAQAGETYDPDGELTKVAAAFSAAIGTNESTEGDSGADVPDIELEADFIECLQENGVDIDADADLNAGIEITDEAAENCF